MTLVEVEVPRPLTQEQIDQLLAELGEIAPKLREAKRLELRRAAVFEQLRNSGMRWVRIGEAAEVSGEAVQQAVDRVRRKRAAVVAERAARKAKG